MTGRSDNLISVKEMTATEVARNFSAVLDAVKSGESVVITRGGERIATLVPTPRANGAALAEALRAWQGNPALDDEWAARVRDAHEVINKSSELDSDPWHE
jgi:prevent-host-death family protein